MSQPVISIIIPVYNAAPYLDQCLSFTCGQTFKDIEIILVDDASTDESGEILKKYADQDSRIHLISLTENIGGGQAKNIGMDHMKGEYFCFVDADDYPDSRMCETFYHHARRTDADFLYSGYYNIDEQPPYLNFKIFEFGAPWARFYRTSIQQQYNLRFTESLGTHDNGFNMLFHLFSARTERLFEPSYFHRINVNGSIQNQLLNTSTSRSAFNIFNCFTMIEKKLKAFHRSPQTEPLFLRRSLFLCFLLERKVRKNNTTKLHEEFYMRLKRYLKHLNFSKVNDHRCREFYYNVLRWNYKEFIKPPKIKRMRIFGMEIYRHEQFHNKRKFYFLGLLILTRWKKGMKHG